MPKPLILSRCSSRTYRCLTIAMLGLSTLLQASPRNETGFPQRLDQLKAAPDNPEAAKILERAERIAQGPILERAYSMEEMEPDSGKRVADSRAKGRSLLNRKPDAAEPFALASGDMAASRIIMNELPLLAAAYRLTESEDLHTYLIIQLEEIVTWVPFQRQGWTLPHRRDPLPETGDGVWLATGTLIQSLALVLNVLPENALPHELEAAVRLRMREEVELTHQHWVERIPWYVKNEAANSNQWIVPASGMVIGAAVLGREGLEDAYQTGVDSLRKSMAITGEDGSMNEGYEYALSWSMTAFLLANHFMVSAGDDSLSQNDFFQNLPQWIALFFQPGENLVNSFDGFSTQRGNAPGKRTPVTLVAGITASPQLQWLIYNVLGGPSHDFFGLLVYRHAQGFVKSRRAGS